MQIITRIKRYLQTTYRQNQELIWAKTWDDTKKGIPWIESMPGISPGRWAVGYNYIYVMTRILDELKPKHILDIGLGISSTLFSNYFEHFNFQDSYHTIIEHDKSWTEFYMKKNRISNISEIHILNCIQKREKGYIYNAYENLNHATNGRKYSLISIDAPIGVGSKKYARRDILDLLPDVLEESFIIIIDDAERKGEKNTIKDIEKILAESNIDFCKGYYVGISDCCVITSRDNQFICSM